MSSDLLAPGDSDGEITIECSGVEALGQKVVSNGYNPVFTIGYQGRSPQGFCEALNANGVSVVVDVRLTPWSRRPGFAKTALAAALAQAGIRYVHEPTLGNPKDNREAFQGDDVEMGRAIFRMHMAQVGGEALQRIADLVGSEGVALVCMESAATRCHRQVVADALLEMGATMEVVTL